MLGPEHDEASHGADSFGEYAINCELLPMIEAKSQTISDPDEDGIELVNGQIKYKLSVRQVIEMQERLKRMELD